METNKEFVNVAIRIKPVADNENQCLRVISEEPPVLLLVDRSQAFSLDNIFTEKISQESVYTETVKPLVQYVKEGYNCTVFAYGQTGTGKTYTMGTDPNVKDEDDFGLIPRTLKHFFEYNNEDESEIEIHLSFIEIYNEKVFDLLQNDNKPPLKIKDLKAQGFNQEKVYSLHEAIHFLKMGNKNRHTGGTKQNSKSSRSHAIFTIYCNTKYRDTETSAKLNLVDLAGCESVKKTGTFGSTFKEGININRGLLSIGQVMTALSNNSTFIPYRQSIITSVLKDSLNKNNFVSLIACVSPLSEDITETVQTLEFAQRVKRIKSKPEVNEVISRYKKENPLLFQLKMNTPFKRPLFAQTPRPPKRQKMSIILEPNQSSDITDQSHSPKSFSSSVASSITNNIRSSLGSDINQQALSPVIRKYVNAMESSLMDKIETVIQNTLKRPSRERAIEQEKENNRTLQVPWSLIQGEVLNIVKAEVAQLSAKTVRATSSPIGEQLLDDVRKVLNYDDSPLADLKSITETEFKLPALPTKKKNINGSLYLSPIENIVPRRSMRLSTKRISRSGINADISQGTDLEFSVGSENISKYLNYDGNTLTSLENSTEETKFKVPASIRKKNNGHIPLSTIDNILPRRSMRLSMKITSRCKMCNNVDDLECEKDVENLQQNLVQNVENSKEYSQRNGSLVTGNGETLQKRIKRLGTKEKRNKNLNILDTPAGKRLLKGIQKDSPQTSHTKTVLHTINHGSSKQIANLHSVGQKTAQHIALYREIKGKLSRLSDLKEIPGWGTKKFDRFIEQNLLKRELL